MEKQNRRWVVSGAENRGAYARTARVVVGVIDRRKCQRPLRVLAGLGAAMMMTLGCGTNPDADFVDTAYLAGDGTQEPRQASVVKAAAPSCRAHPWFRLDVLLRSPCGSRSRRPDSGPRSPPSAIRRGAARYPGGRAPLSGAAAVQIAEGAAPDSGGRGPQLRIAGPVCRKDSGAG